MTDAELEALFQPGPKGPVQPVPTPGARRLSPASEKAHALRAELQAKGLAAFIGKSDISGVLKDYGIPTEVHKTRLVDPSSRKPYSAPAPEKWGPAWAVAIVCADPIGDNYRWPALERARDDEHYQAAVMSTFQLGGMKAVAEFVMGGD